MHGNDNFSEYYSFLPWFLLISEALSILPSMFFYIFLKSASKFSSHILKNSLLQKWNVFIHSFMFEPFRVHTRRGDQNIRSDRLHIPAEPLKLGRTPNLS